jgi:hypothetical protein
MFLVDDSGARSEFVLLFVDNGDEALDRCFGELHPLEDPSSWRVIGVFGS